MLLLSQKPYVNLALLLASIFYYLISPIVPGNISVTTLIKPKLLLNKHIYYDHTSTS
jgi:hypothetical protein